MSQDTSTQSLPSTSTEELPAARSPRGVGPAPAVASVVALALLLLGLCGVHDFLAAMGWINGPEWIGPTLRHAGVLQTHAWMLAVFIAAIIVAVLLVAVGLKPRPKKAVRVHGQTGIYLRYGDLEELVARAAERTDGVESASASVDGPRKVSLAVESTAGPDAAGEMEADVTASVDPILDALETRPDLKVQVKGSTS